MKIIVKGTADIRYEDSGCAMIVEVSSEDHEVFVRLQSWNEDKNHYELKSVIGDIENGVSKSIIKVTIEKEEV